MKNLSPILRELGAGRLSFWCPGCNDAHQILYGTGPGPRWGYNGHVDLPTFTPSIKVTWREPSDNPAEQLDDSKDIGEETLGPSDSEWSSSDYEREAEADVSGWWRRGPGRPRQA